MRSFLVAFIALCLSPALVQASASDLTWPDLIDPAVQEYDDPYRDLTVDQLYDLRTVVRLRARLGEADVSPEAKPRIEERLADTEDALTKAGIEIDWLLSQRWIVADRRQAAMNAGNPDVDGQIITLAGFAIPGPPDREGFKTAYLVPERGMCSHTPPPNPNQMVRIRLGDDWQPTRLHEPVRLTGKITISPSQESMYLVDGRVPMNATFLMEAETVQTFEQPAVPRTLAGHRSLLEKPPVTGRQKN